LAANFELDDTDIRLLVCAAAPDLDWRFERVFGFLHDDLTRRRCSVSLALRLIGADLLALDAGRLSPGGRLISTGLVEVVDEDRPFGSRALRVPQSVVDHLLGAGIAPPPADPAETAWGPTSDLADALERGARLVYLREQVPGTGLTLARGALTALGLGAHVVYLAAETDVGHALLAARLSGCGLVLCGHGSTAAPERNRLARLGDAPWITLLVDRVPWDPAAAVPVDVIVDVPAPTAADRAAWWGDALNSAERVRADLDALGNYRHGPDQIRRAVHSARLASAEPDTAAFARAVRTHHAAGLQRLARRTAATANWPDLVLPAETLAQLHDLHARAVYRETVFGPWAMSRVGNRGRGVTALFAGPSGTGKTLAAEVLANSLGLDLYTVEVATVVDKYIGETEKNLERVFAEAEALDCVLLFDEADALFGRRSDVRDARDRYANLEVAYLLQRVESFDGLALLTTNLVANLDDAFARRLDLVVEFPVPDVAARRRLWDACLGCAAPRGEDIDLDFCAASFELTGGNIRNITLAAAYAAASAHRDIRMRDLIRATQAEYRKLGRLCLEAEYGPWHSLLTEEVTA
jgi:hypothetical protein